MGSMIEINDTLQLTREQGFPSELDLDVHLKTPYTVESYAGKIFSFTNKPGIRMYHVPPVRNFLVENHNGKWVYWGLVHVLETKHDYRTKTTSGTFTILYLYTPDEMRHAHAMIDRNQATKFFE